MNRKTRGDIAFDVFNYTLMTLLLLTWLYPMWYCLIQSVSNTVIISTREVWIVPRYFTWINYKTVLADSRILTAFSLSVRITLLGATMSVLCNAAAAYALSKKELYARKTITTIILVSMYFGGGLIPWYLLMQGLHLNDSFWGFILPMLYSGYTIIVMRTFFSSLPPELEESAKIDGANELQRFVMICLPLSKAVLATMWLFAAVSQWNNWMTGDLLMTKPNLKPMSTVLMEIITRNKLNSSSGSGISGAEVVTGANKPTSTGIKMAAVMVTVVPILCVYPFLQRFFAKGVLVGSVKG